MASKRLFNGVAHDLAHHAQSGLSYMHPHVTRDCRAHSMRQVSADLLSPAPWPAGFKPSKPLRVATDALRETLARLISQQGLAGEDLQTARLTFHLVEGKDDWTTQVSSLLQLKDGKTYTTLVKANW